MCMILPTLACGMMTTLLGSYAVAVQPQALWVPDVRYVASHGKSLQNKPLRYRFRGELRMAGALLSSGWLSPTGFERS